MGGKWEWGKWVGAIRTMGKQEEEEDMGKQEKEDKIQLGFLSRFPRKKEKKCRLFGFSLFLISLPLRRHITTRNFLWLVEGRERLHVLLSVPSSDRNIISAEKLIRFSNKSGLLILFFQFLGLEEKKKEKDENYGKFARLIDAAVPFSPFKEAPPLSPSLPPSFRYSELHI